MRRTSAPRRIMRRGSGLGSEPPPEPRPEIAGLIPDGAVNQLSAGGSNGHPSLTGRSVSAMSCVWWEPGSGTCGLRIYLAPGDGAEVRPGSHLHTGRRCYQRRLPWPSPAPPLLTFFLSTMRINWVRATAVAATHRLKPVQFWTSPRAAAPAPAPTTIAAQSHLPSTGSVFMSSPSRRSHPPLRRRGTESPAPG